MRKILYMMTIVHLLYQLVYMTLGQLPTSGLGAAQYVFYLFRPEYMIVSGIVALAAAVSLLVLLLRGRRRMDAVMLTLNLEYIVYYAWLIMQQ